ncbi:MAG: DNA-binding protein [Elusimicrobia bacterium]|nr:DNA-binding protein [Elusimicrobiota bacterium]
MEHCRINDDTLLVRLEAGEEVISTITTFLNSQKIYAGTIEGIGAAGEAQIGIFDAHEKNYRKITLAGPLEILSLLGNVSQTEDGRSFLHSHVVLGDHEMKTFGGHLFKAVADPTCEIVIKCLPGIIRRRPDPRLGLKFWDFLP